LRSSIALPDALAHEIPRCNSNFKSRTSHHARLKGFPSLNPTLQLKLRIAHTEAFAHHVAIDTAKPPRAARAFPH